MYLPWVISCQRYFTRNSPLCLQFAARINLIFWNNLEIKNIMDDPLRPKTVPLSAETILWFEFLLDPSLLTSHLAKANPGGKSKTLTINCKQLKCIHSFNSRSLTNRPYNTIHRNVSRPPNSAVWSDRSWNWTSCPTASRKFPPGKEAACAQGADIESCHAPEVEFR